MNLTRLFLLFASACSFLIPATILADDVPFHLGEQSRVDIVMKNDPDMLAQLGQIKGRLVERKLYIDNHKIRLEWIFDDRVIRTSIVRPDLQKIYTILPILSTHQQVGVEPYDPDFLKPFLPRELHGKFDDLGSETVNGVSCHKYKYTPNAKGKAQFVWVDAATQAPVRMAAVDGSSKILWKNYQAGPQDASLFEIPPGYSTTPFSTPK